MADEKENIDNDIKDDSKASELRRKFNVNIIQFESENYNNEEAKCLHITLTDKESENKYQIYEKTFTVGECAKIKKDAKFEVIPLPKFVALMMDCLSIQNKSHAIDLKIDHKKYVEITITYAPDKYTEIKFKLTIPAKEMKEIDLLKLRLKEAEDKIKHLENKKTANYEAILFAETVTDSKRREKGWNNIPLNYSSHNNDEFVKLNAETGVITIAKGVYIIEAHAESWNVQGLIIQLKSDDEQIVINGIPSYGASAIGASRIMRQTMRVETDTVNIVFRQWVALASAHGVHYNSHWPQQELNNIYVACVSIQKIK